MFTFLKDILPSTLVLQIKLFEKTFLVFLIASITLMLHYFSFKQTNIFWIVKYYIMTFATFRLLICIIIINASNSLFNDCCKYTRIQLDT